MPANTPEEICRLFQQYMLTGDLDAVLTLYDREVAFLNQAGDVIRGRDRLKLELSPLVARSLALSSRLSRLFKPVTLL